MDINDPIKVQNAGIVILAPFLPRLFSMLLTEDNKFKDDASRAKAVFLLHYFVWEREEAKDQELVMNKLLVGMDINDPVPLRMELSIWEKEAITSLQNIVLYRFEKIGKRSTKELRELFFIRNGSLEEKEDTFELTVEERAYDILLDRMPWTFKIIRNPWVKKVIWTKWREH